FNRQPLGIETDEQNRVTGVRVVETKLGEPDARGRRVAVPIEGSESVIEADVVIIAFGFSPTVPEWMTKLGIEGTSNGRIVAGGDAVRGADLVVTAVAEGRDAAASIAELLGTQTPVRTLQYAEAVA